MTVTTGQRNDLGNSFDKRQTYKKGKLTANKDVAESSDMFTAAGVAV